MLCQFCGTNKATSWEREHPAPGPGVLVACCPVCRDERSSRRPDDGRGIPRPTLTLGRVMLLVASFAIPNALVAWVARSGPFLVSMTPEQRAEWISSAFLMVNVCAGMVVAYSVASRWLCELARYRRTSGGAPRPAQGPLTSPANLNTISFFWAFYSVVVTNTLWPARSLGLHEDVIGFIATALTGLGLLVIVLWRKSAIRPVFGCIRREWGDSSGIERSLKVLAFSWPMGLALSLRLRLIPPWVVWSINPWLILPGLFAIVLGYKLVFAAGEALSARRA